MYCFVFTLMPFFQRMEGKTKFIIFWQRFVISKVCFEGIFSCLWIKKINSFRSSVAFHTEISHSIYFLRILLDFGIKKCFQPSFVLVALTTAFTTLLLQIIMCKCNIFLKTLTFHCSKLLRKLWEDKKFVYMHFL